MSIPSSKSENILLQRLLSGGIWTVLGRVVTVAAGFVVNALIARMIPVGEVGAYFLLVSVVTVGSIIASLGLQVAVVRLVAQAVANQLRGVARATIVAVLRIGTISSIVVAVIIGLGGDIIASHIFNAPIITQVAWDAAVWMVTIVILNLLAESFRGFHDFRLATIFSNNTCTNVLMMIALGVTVAFHKKTDLQFILVLAISSGVLSILIAASAMRKRLKKLDRSDNFRALSVLQVGLPLMISSVAIFLLTQADLWIIGISASAEDVAMYGATTRLGQLVYMPLLISNTLLPPFISEMYSQRKIKQLENVMRVASTLSAFSAAIVLLVVFFAGETILTLAYGEYYRKAHLLLVLICVGQFVNVWSGSGMITLINTGHQKAVMNISFIFGGLIVIGALVVVKQYGITGVALVTGLVTAAQALFVLFWVKKKTDIWTHASPRYLSLAWQKFAGAKSVL